MAGSADSDIRGVKMGVIYAVGIGPGKKNAMTLKAIEAIEKSDIVVGYEMYADQVRAIWPYKDIRSSGMRQEEKRCSEAIELAASGSTVAVVSSGDAGVYGMAGLLIELCGDRDDIDIVVVAGVTAALSGAARLGSPLTNDFCVISLSDLLTPWDTIEKRLKAAAEGDFVTVLYNPGSHRRTDNLKKACEIMLESKPGSTICGIIRSIGREDESYRIVTLEELSDTEVDMVTTVFIGNPDTVIIDDRMVTKRGYHTEG